MTDAGWDDLKLFLHVASEGGLSGAAARTGLSAPTIGRRMLALERATGRTLFVRSHQGYRLAPDGETLLEHVRAMQKTADSIADWKAQAFAMPIVSIGADAWLSGFVSDHTSELRGREDRFRLCCKSLHRGLDFTYRETDVGIVGRRPESGNVAIRRSVTVAHCIYRVDSLAEDETMPWVSIGTESSHSPADKWVFQHHEADIRTWTNSPELLLRLIASGNGRGVLPCFIGDSASALVREGGIIAELTYTMWIVANDDDRHRPEVRQVIERLDALFKREAERFSGDQA
ncbi:LysR family transcriptional regulator [Neorhizobium galegae]|uniref:LysR family transcriptional regulator n=1 Tax=Neorhizobium galegae TaxID=399 RepID=UPI000622966D|nr:LysR family transcriptional regulator [Neorhizobium galegae]KAB1126477.1 LysR family transcriptional regulator [Neorhizobium galegae]MCQ1808115.1 LysR family transcriptional regulator [Neorhizobium galegae]CDZ62515.1 Transcriptional regulator, LysR family [Neorhizobium galegae bv. orientalis]